MADFSTVSDLHKGIAVSPGVAVGTAYCILEIFVNPEKTKLEPHEITQELARYETARDQTSSDLSALQSKVESQVGKDEAAIFAAHRTILRDPAFTNKIRHWIVDERMTAQGALHRLLDEYTLLFSRMGDPYLQERLNDIRDVIIRLSAYLTDVLNDPDGGDGCLKGPLIVVADELLPSQAVALGDADVHGIVTERGSQTSHAAIIARSRGIPAVSGVPGIAARVKTGDTIVVNGREGIVVINPEAEELSAYRKLEREFFDLKDQLAANRDLPACTACGQDIELMANINNVQDAAAASAMGAGGVGLYRTEYLYLTHENVPDEAEQIGIYRQVINASPNRTVTIRTLDIGGDKTVAYLGHNHNEANPFMGWRSVRLSFEHPEFFMSQIRAILQSGVGIEGSEVRMMFPMITTVEELRKIRSFVRRAQRRLIEEKKPFADVKVGMMLEVPAAAVVIRSMLDLVDFVSIGSNDLVQYLMAADRDNPKVSNLCQPLAPAVVHTLNDVIRACNMARVPVTLCGEMAGQPRAFILLLGMGLRSFSMSPAFVPTIKQLASQITIERAESLLARALQMKTTNQVKRFLRMELEEISPDIAKLDTDG
ncbi:Phosphoenolpyruvate-protein kinase (PTS system EI component in bacteria) [Blastopirellula marina DSM 3645]|uniref:Phosphoenolpyruvate-protein phosphotransferase n=1 Tax=Blastopirellula marina DSM 3645 TaxID=314230 RepID=A4A1W2_9BACT|nr:Phosphoenolpyruvate-protein kinase (PTS system EI component in bacteria) [Blastopirellula marina DSM 3645]